MSERPNVVLVPTPRTPDSALSVQIELEREPKDPWETSLYDTMRQTMEEVLMLRTTADAYLLGNPVMNLPPVPTALPHILSNIGSLAKTIASVIESQISNLEKITDREQAAKFVAKTLNMSRKFYHALAMTIAEYTSTVVHGLVTAPEVNSWAWGIGTGMVPVKMAGEVAVQQERR